jgi:phage tail protein X
MPRLSQPSRYRTQQGDRWDLIAYRFYADPMNFEPIIVANPDIPIYVFFLLGVEMVVPVAQVPWPDSLDLPLWLQRVAIGAPQ